MTFDEWWNLTIEVGYDSAKKLARDAWEAATKHERDVCYALCLINGNNAPTEEERTMAGACAEAIRKRSHAG